MDSLWWQMPGPARFLDRIDDDLRQGRNVVVPAPPHLSTELREAVGDRISRNDFWRWRRLELGDTSVRGASPPEFLLSELGGSTREVATASPRSVAGADALRGFVIWIDGLTVHNWPAWKSFLVEYEHARRNGHWDAPLLCAGLPGFIDSELGEAQIALVSRPWSGASDRLDMAMYASHLLSDRRLPRLHKRLLVSACTELAGFDHSIARVLATLSLESVLAPMTALLRIAGERGWVESMAGAPEWSNGMMDELEGSRFVHSAAVALAGDAAEISRRVWRAEVGIVFPFIEEQRIELLEPLRGRLRLPIDTHFGRIEEPEDLEVGHLLWLARSLDVPRRTLRLLERLVRMRHALAHLEPVALTDLTSPEVLSVA